MSKAEKFIQSHTRNCSNTTYLTDDVENPEDYCPWLTPEQARKAVEIAREEIYDWLANRYRDYMHNPTGKKLEAFFGIDMIEDLKKHLEGKK